jgi:hypothetical protein
MFVVYSMDTTQSNYSKQVLSNSDYGNDKSRSCKILPANHLHKSLSHCNDRGPYHRTTAAKRMQRHFLAAELLYI